MQETWIARLFGHLPRPEYAKQTESLLTDLLWRSEGSSLASDINGNKMIEHLSRLKVKGEDPDDLPEPERLVPRKLRGGSPRTLETIPLAESFNVTGLVTVPTGARGPVRPLLESLRAPQARGDKSTACVPIHPATVALQTLHGLVNKPIPANLARAIESMAWLGGALKEGAAAGAFLALFTETPDPRKGATGAIEWLLPRIAAHAWAGLPAKYSKPSGEWPAWPPVTPAVTIEREKSALSAYRQAPFAWFWTKWLCLCDPASQWHDRLPARRFVDWSLCLLRTGLAFAYLWEAEFFCRLHQMVVNRLAGSPPISPSPINSLLSEGAVLATIEPPEVPASQKGIWPATSDLIARGWKARDQLLNAGIGDTLPTAASLANSIELWVEALTGEQLSSIGTSIRVTSSMANNQKEFVRYLLLPRSSDDDSVDHADFYYLARSSGRHMWFRPGPEWLVVITSLLCVRPGGSCTLGDLRRDLVSLGVRVERSVIVGMLEEAGLSTDSPDADDALVIRAGF
ncbi:MAG: hypothetical protein ACREK6_00190 [Candidatus Rokuibacteriota bacterium]